MQLKILTARNIYVYFYFMPSQFQLEVNVGKGFKMMNFRTHFFSSG